MLGIIMNLWTVMDEPGYLVKPTSPVRWSLVKACFVREKLGNLFSETRFAGKRMDGLRPVSFPAAPLLML